MAGSLLALLDDIASVLDDVSLLTQAAAKKTAGVLGDDLALNAQQVSGVQADRELPVVWAVAKGSALNKVILVPAALAISQWLPGAVTPLLMAGGLFLCFEGVEKLAHRLLHGPAERQAEHQRLLQSLERSDVSLDAFEKDRVRGAIRTDFILSAEIVTIALGTVTGEPLSKQAIVLAGVALLMTVGVYGLVAGIVKLDDAGLALSRRAGWQRGLGRGLLTAAPALMKFLSVAGTAAMFLVGGGILLHGWPGLHVQEWLVQRLALAPGLWLSLGEVLLQGLAGVLAGALALLAWTGVQRLRSPRAP